MKKGIKGVLSVILAAIMAFAIPVTAFASTLSTMSLTVNNDSDPKLYAGITYEICATATNISQSELIESETSAFTWTTNNSSVAINSTNNYSYTKTGTTYTVTEIAKFTMPNENTSLSITAKYGDVISKTLTKTALTPITSISLSCENTSYVNYNSETDTLYIDQTLDTNFPNTAKFTADYFPTVNDDSLFFGSSLASDKITSFVTENGFSFCINKNAAEKSTITVTPNSGYPFTKTIDVTRCIPLTSFELTAVPYNSTTGIVVSNSLNNSIGSNQIGATTAIQGDNITIKPSSKKTASGTSNDGFKYTLYNDPELTSESPSSYYSVDNNYNCTLNIPNPKTYYLVCENISAGNGCLKRNLSAVTAITITQAKPIETIGFYELDNLGNMTSTPLTEKTLYTNSSATYDISKNVSIAPNGYTHGIRFVSNDTSIAKVDASTGLITALKGGDTTVYAISEDSDSVTARCDIHVVVGIIGITAVNVEDNCKKLPAGHSIQLTAVTNPTNADEKINWSSSNPDVLSISNNGVAKANPNYSGTEETTVTVTAKSEFGKTGTVLIDVIPSIRATSIKVNVSSADNSLTFENNGNDIYSDYIGKSYNISYTANENNDSNDIFVWKVLVGDTFVDFADASTYFSYTYDSVSNSYKITTKTNSPLDIYCFAQKRGESFSTGNVYGKAVINSKAKVTTIAPKDPNTNANKTSVTLPTGVSTDFRVDVNIDAYYTDELDFKSSDENIATVTKLGVNTFRVNAISVGSCKINITCKSGNKTSAINVLVTNNIDTATVSGVDSMYVYNGKAIAPVPTVTFNNIVLNSSSHYSLTYANNTNAGTATLTIKGKGDFNTSSKVITYQIAAKTMSYSNISISAIANQKLSDKVRSVTPAPAVKDTQRNATLKKDTDYTLTYYNNTAAGTATVVITGKGNYTGSVSTTFNIIDVATNFYVAPIKTCSYTGKALTPAVTVTYFGNVLRNGVDYTVAYSNNINVGKATAKITGIGKYNGVVSTTFDIAYKKPAKPTLSKLTKGKKSFKAKWKKVSGVSGYEIQYSTSKKFTKKTTKSTKASKSSTTSKTIKKLKAKKTYYVRVRTYKNYKVNGKTVKVNSSWSKVKSVKTK